MGRKFTVTLLTIRILMPQACRRLREVTAIILILDRLIIPPTPIQDILATLIGGNSE